MFFVSVASKGLRYCASSLFCNTYKGPISVASKGLTLHQNGANVALGTSARLDPFLPEADGAPSGSGQASAAPTGWDKAGTSPTWSGQVHRGAGPAYTD